MATDTKAKGDLAKSQLANLTEMVRDGSINATQLNEFLATIGIEGVVSDSLVTTKRSRIETKRRWLTAKGLNDDELETIKNLPEVIGSATTILSEEEARILNVDEIDSLMEEELCRRHSEDILKGRYDAIRATILNHVTAQHPGEENAVGDVTSLKNGAKFVVGTQERGGNPDYSALEEVVGPEIWEEITAEVVTREVDEEKLLAAMMAGKISVDDYAKIIPDKQVIRTLTVRQLKAGDKIQ